MEQVPAPEKNFLLTRPSDNFFMRYATVIAIAAVTVLMLAAAAIYYRQNEAAVVMRSWVDHSFEVKGHIQALMTKLEDAETGERGFIATGNEEFLEPYNDALRNSSDNRPKSDALDQHHSIAEEIGILRRMTSDNPTQQQNLDDIERGAKDLLDYLASTIRARKDQNDGAAAKPIDLLRTKEMMDHLRSLISLMTLEEDHLLDMRMQADQAAVQENRLIVFSSVAFFYLLLVISIWFYQRARRRAQMELFQYAQQLERSEEELKMQQEELKASNEEIEAANEELEEQNAQIRQQADELTRNKQLIEEKSQEVERASRYKTEFLANMSHELRTPLNSLLILARSLANNEEGNLTPSQVEEAHIIHNDGLELLNLINDILDLSKVEAGKLNIVIDDVELESMVHRLRQQFAPIAKDKGVAFPIEIEEGLPETLRTDTQRAEQILKNLLSNAFKFTKEGSVTLKVHRPDAQMELQRVALDAGNSVAISVIDTGIGIEASKLKDIFEAFQQEDGSTDRHYGGTGLGLTIARKFAHLLGGGIYVSSVKGEGSTFTLILPVKLEAQDPGKARMVQIDDSLKIDAPPVKALPRLTATEFIPDDRNSIAKGEKVLLIVEDDRNFATTLMKIARKRGYKCLAAGDGKTGLLLAMERPVTAIILDLKLPDIDGIQVLDHLKHDLRTRHIPVHIVTGRSEEQSVVSMRKGAIGYLTKPVAEEGLNDAFAKIETLLETDVKRILVVEDDQKSQVAIQNLLKKKDIQISVAGTGTEALTLLREQPFDCVILDLRLPDMTGFKWMQEAEKSIGDAGLPPIVVYTAKELTEAENREINRYTGSIIIKGARSPERLLDEVTLFLHSVESTLSKEQQTMIRMQHDPDTVLQGRNVLLVDDDLRNTFALSKLLRKHGMNVVIADNGQMALDTLAENKNIELVIMDIMMPVMDGYQAMKEIRKQKERRNLPIIALTARTMPQEQERCMAAGANDYLTKPVDVEKLLTLMRVWLFRQEMTV